MNFFTDSPIFFVVAAFLRALSYCRGSGSRARRGTDRRKSSYCVAQVERRTADRGRS